MRTLWKEEGAKYRDEKIFRSIEQQTTVDKMCLSAGIHWKEHEKRRERLESYNTRKMSYQRLKEEKGIVMIYNKR